ncbi:MAG: secretin N-terminal domain-containing protein [Phycisphaerae bacterium]|nr:secretin N-terminal domain-containing protein [Phycisphaerae bacterium]
MFLLSIMSMSGLCLAQQDQQQTAQIIRVRIFTLRNISAETAKEYLRDASIASTVVAIPNTTAISVTAGPQELVKASTVLRLVDANEQFGVQMLDIPAGQPLPSLRKIEEKLGRAYSIGSLMEGPVSGASIKAIVDIQDDKVILISPQGQTAKITGTLLASMAEVKAEPAKPIIASANDVNVVFTAEPVVIEANMPQPETMVNVAVGGKVQTEEDKLLAELVSELTEAVKAEKEEQKTKAEQALSSAVEQEQIIVAAPQESVPQRQTENAAEKIQPRLSAESQDLPAVDEVLPANQPEDFNQQESVAMPVIDIPNGDELLTLDLPEKMEVVSLIDLVGKYLNLNYLYDETKVAGSVTIKVQDRLRVRELYDLLESVLKFRGFVMSRKGDLVTIVPMAEALDQDPTFSGDVQAGDVIVTKVFHLQYISTDAARNLLMSMKLGSSITPIPETGTLVITEYAFRIQRIEDLLTLVDVPGPPKEFKLRVLKYTLAESLVPKIQVLAVQLGTVNITVGSMAAAQPAVADPRRRTRRPATPQPQPQDASTKTGVFVDFDKRTNRVMMIGLTDEIAAVDQIIDSLDVPQQDLRVISEYEMQFVDIDSVVTALKDLGIIDSAVATGGKSGSRAQPAQPGQPPRPAGVNTGDETATSLDQPQVVMLTTTNSLLVNATPEQHLQISKIISYVDREPAQNAIPYRIYRLENQEPEALAEVLNNLIEKTVKDKEGKIQQTIKIQEDNIAIVPDKNTFSLIVYASKKNQEWIGSLIQTLDTRRPQVLIDVSLVEITRNDAFQFDLDMVANAKGLVTDNLVLKPSYLSAIGGNREASFVGGTTKGFYSADKIQALLTLVNTNGYGRVLAQPKVLVNDNEEGSISTTSQRFVKEESQSASGSSGDVISKAISWKAYDAKIELKIKPQISEGDLLRLEVEMLREDFGTKEEPNAPPPKTTSNVTTVVTVPDGSTIILGGLNKLDQSKTSGKTPLLGDIPLVGGLFKKIDNSNDEQRLYIFVKANILRPNAELGLTQLKRISKKNQTEFERAEGKFQRYESFPGMKAEIIEPERILEQGVNEPDANDVNQEE